MHMGALVSVLTVWLALFAHVRLSGCGKQALPELSMCLLTREQRTDLSRHPVLLCVFLLAQLCVSSL